MHTLSNLALGLFLLGISLPLQAQLDLTTDPKCRESQTQLRQLFMGYEPGQALNLKYLEDLYYTCDDPHPRSTLIYYYLKSANLLKAEDNYVEAPSDMFRYFYREFGKASEGAAEVARQDPDFGRLLEKRSKELADKLAIAEQSAGKPVLSAASTSSREVASENISEDPIFGSGAATGTRSINPPRGASSEDMAVAPGQFPYYPVPVESASAQATLPNRAFRKARTLGEVDAHLQSILNNHGYYTRNYFSVPDGFALVTQLERIQSDGTPENDWDRWSTSVSLNKTFALREYFLSLVFAQPGYYRSFALVVTPQEMLTDPWAGNGRLNEGVWRYSDGSKVPPQVGALPFTSPPYQVTVMVYEFEVPASDQNARLVMSREQGGKGLSAQEHLAAAGLWDDLTK